MLMSLVACLLAAGLATLFFILLSFRREAALGLYAGAFAAFLLAALAYGLQDGVGSPAIILANALLAVYHLCLLAGLRHARGLTPAMPRRYMLWVLLWIAGILVTRLSAHSDALDALVNAPFLIVLGLEFLQVLRLRSPAQPMVRRAAWVIVLAFVTTQLVRLVWALLVLGDVSADAELALEAFTFVLILFFPVQWAGLLLILDATDMEQKLRLKNHQLEALASTDELTGLGNRHLLETRIHAEMERAHRYNQSLSLILLDIDYFKRVNDTWGHDMGDQVLAKVARLARAQIREPDTMFRWGGEEFMILAPHTTLEGAVYLAGKVRESIAAAEFLQVGKVTASFGVAEWRDQASREYWFRQVDQALYRAKNGGRNRVFSFGPEDRLPVAMIRLEWQESLESGNPLIDAQHRELFDLANGVLDLAGTKASDQDLLQAVDVMLANVARHFADEEALLQSVGYSEGEAHARLHADLLKNAADLRARVAAGESSVSALYDFLVGRVVNEHLIHADSQYFALTRAHPGQDDQLP